MMTELDGNTCTFMAELAISYLFEMSREDNMFLSAVSLASVAVMSFFSINDVQ
jgi:hypothetical protein